MAGRPFIPAAQVARMLDERAEAVAREVCPGGHLEGAEWVAPSICGNSFRGLSVRIRGTKCGVFKEFDGTAAGDTLAYVAHVRFRGDMKAAYAWALNYLGLSQGAVPAPVQPAAKAPRADRDEGEQATRRAAQRLFLSARAELRDTPVDAYLRGRCIELAELGRQPRALRFHPACQCIEVDADMPAMLAAITGPDGTYVATHRTFLAQDGHGTWRKAPLRAPKKVLGRFVGGAIRLWRGASGKPFKDAPEADTIVIAEGIENALSCVLACPEYRVLAAVSLANLACIVLPPQAIDIVIAADNDTGNAAAEATLRRAVDRLLMQGRSVRVAHSSNGKDFNSSLMAAE